jgi:acyl carrier protein
VIDDGTIESLTPEQVERVLRAKVDAALHLHELTAGLPLSEFVLFSSLAGTVGAPGQGNYAGANACLDALAQTRRAHGQPAQALAWGPWEVAGGMAAQLDEADRARVERLGVKSLSSAFGLELLERSRSAPRSLLVLADFDMSVLRTLAQAELLPPLLRGLVSVPARRKSEDHQLARRLAGVPEDEREAIVLAEVRGQIATVLGHPSVNDIDTELTFAELEFDSLDAIELRNRLAIVSGVKLQPTAAFDHPTPAAVARLLCSEIAVPENGAAPDRQAAATNGDIPAEALSTVAEPTT